MARRSGFFKRGGIWYVRTDPVTKRARSTGCADYQAAQLWKAHRERLAADPVRAAAEHARLGLWCKRLLDTKSDQNGLYLLSKLKWFVELWGDCPLANIAPPTVDNYVERRRARGVTDQTISKELGALKQVLKLAKRAGQYGGDLDVLRPPWLRSTGAPRTRALTPDEVSALLGATEGRLRAFIALAIATGARRSEVFRVRPEDISEDAIVIRGKKTQRAAGSLPVLGPYRPLLDLARPELPLEYPNNLSRDIERACERAGIDRCTPNDLRRTHITLLREAGIDRDTAKQLLRHSPSSNLLDRVYDQSRPEEIARRVGPVLEAMPPVWELQKRNTKQPRPDGQAPAILAQLVEQRFRKPLRPNGDGSCAESASDGENYEPSDVSPRVTVSGGETRALLALAAARMGVLPGRTA